MLAWQVIVPLVAPAGVPGSSNVEFETWASDEDLYKANPPQWPAVGAPKKVQPSVFHRVVAEHSLKLGLEAAAPGACRLPREPGWGNFPAGVCIAEEVRQNWPAFRYAVANNLYTVQGLQDAFKSGTAVDLPAGAIQLKADWVKIGDLRRWIPQVRSLTLAQIRGLYHTSAVTFEGSTDEYALVGISLSAKLIKTWVWMTVEHQMNPGRCDTIGCRDAFGAVDDDVPPLAAENEYYGRCRKSAALRAVMKSAGLDEAWNNYCLKGTQITFVDAYGQPTLLGNSVIERVDKGVPMDRISCITCHGYASFNAQGLPNYAILSPPQPIGPLDPAKLNGWKPSDYVWGILSIGR